MNFISNEKALAQLNQRQTVEDFMSTGSLKLPFASIAYAYCIPENAKAAIVISNGRIESYLKYQELLWELNQNHFAVFILDHPGQGLSSRFLADHHKGYIKHFQDYVDCFDAFNHHIVDKHWHGKKYLLAHSMGAAIAQLYLATKQHRFDKAVMSAPMFGINPGNTPLWLAKTLLHSMAFLNLKKSYFLQQKPYIAKPFENNSLTQSETRYQVFRKLYQTVPTLQLGGVTVNWLKEALLAIKKIKTVSHHTPTLVLQAGQDDIVCNTAQNEIVQQTATMSLKCYPQAKHELLFEKDTIRHQMMTDIYQFLTTTDIGS